MTMAAREAVRLATTRPGVKVITVIRLVGLAAEAFDRLSTPLLIDRFAFPAVLGNDSPVIWFGISGVAGTLLGLAASEIFDVDDRTGELHWSGCWRTRPGLER